MNRSPHEYSGSGISGNQMNSEVFKTTLHENYLVIYLKKRDAGLTSWFVFSRKVVELGSFAV